jgi:anti-sigma regulatory factor (Ser/Thr protein kinase)
MRHELFSYDADTDLVDRVAPFLVNGLSEDEAVVAVTTPRREALLRKALGAAADRTLFLDRDAFYTRPEAVLAGYDATVRRVVKGPVAGMRVMGELPFCESRAEWDVWMCYEAILNRAFAHQPVWILCAYDTTAVPADVLETARHAHPVVAADQDASVAHEHYLAPEAIVSALRAPPIADPVLQSIPLETDARRFRAVLADALARADVDDERTDRMLIAAGEVLVNAQRHGGGLRSIRVGRVGARFVCELADHGRGIDDPLAGYLPPRAGSDADAGLWVTRQLTWRFELVPSDDGLAARLWV